MVASALKSGLLDPERWVRMSLEEQKVVVEDIGRMYCPTR